MSAAADLIARIHFAGSTTISADPEFHPFNNLFCSTNAQALQEQTLDKLARFPRAWIGTRASSKIGDGYLQLRPLLDDFVHNEWFLEARDSSGIAPEFALAIHLSDDRAKLWEQNLTVLLTAWTALPTQSIPGGWWIKKHEPPDSIRFSRVGEWVVLSCEQGKFALGDALLQQIKASQRPVAALNGWLSVEADWARLGRYFPGLQELDLPRTVVELTAKNGDLSWDGKLDLAQSWPAYGNWQIPTNDLRQPFVSFTAARGVSTWLQHQGWAQKYLVNPVPNQLFVWAMAGMPFMTYAALPVQDSHAALLQLNEAFSTPPASRPPGNAFAFTPHVVMTNNQINLQGFPFASPFIQAQHNGSADFIFGGFFPNTSFIKPLPVEMLNTLARKDLILYHWELTRDRLKTLPQLAQLMLLLNQKKQLGENSLASKWLKQVGPGLGVTMTVATLTGPNEINFTQKGTIGLSAVELFAFCCWLEAPDFPGCNLKMPPMIRHARPLNAQPPKTAMPLLIH
jgi:hypothetical protein